MVGTVKTISITCEGRRWYVILTADQARPEPLEPTGSTVGIDLGLANFLADSGGGFVPNPRHGHKAAAKLEAAQQALARCNRSAAAIAAPAASVCVERPPTSAPDSSDGGCRSWSSERVSQGGMVIRTTWHEPACQTWGRP